MKKTNVLRLIESAGIECSTKSYKVDENSLDAVSVANKINENVERVFKTLVAEGSNTGNIVFVIPGDFELDLKKAAKASGNKKIDLIKLKDLQKITGYIRGGCSPIGMKKEFSTYLDESAFIFEKIFVSAGVRGLQVELTPKDLCKLIKCNVAELI